RYRLASGRRYRRLARADWHTFQKHGAGATQPGATPELGSGEADLIAYHPQQWGVRFRFHAHRLAVDLQLGLHCGLLTCGIVVAGAGHTPPTGMLARVPSLRMRENPIGTMEYIAPMLQSRTSSGAPSSAPRTTPGLADSRQAR